MTPKKIGICLLFGIILTSCSKEDLTPPDPPVLIPHGDDADTIEAGIDAVPEGNWIYLEWRENTEEDLAGYIVYRDSLPGPGFSSVTPVITDPFTLDQGVTLGIPYYYTVTAVDMTGNESMGGDTLHYTLVSKPSLIFPLDNDLLSPGEIIFRWELDPVNEGYFIVKIFSSGVDSLLYMSEAIDIFGAQSEYNDTLYLPPGYYRWRVDYGNSGQNLGSESQFRILTLQ